MGHKSRGSIAAAFFFLTACAQPFAPDPLVPAPTARPSPVSTALPPLPSAKAGAAVVATLPGTYTYTTVSKGPQGEERSEHSDEFEPPVEVSPGIFRQKVWHLQSANSRPYYVEYLLRHDGSFATSHSSWGPACYYGPPIKQLPHASVEVGDRRNYRSFCANDTVPRREVTGYAKVIRKEDLVIGGETVSTLVLEYYGKMIGRKSNTAFFNRGTEWYSPQYRLIVKQTFQYNSIPTQSADLEYSQELTSLSPT